MEINVLWQSREYRSLENAKITSMEDGWVVSSIIIGFTEEKICKVEYIIKTNLNWETTFVQVKSLIGDAFQTHNYQGDGKGGWLENGIALEEFRDCIDIDIPLTPLTNSLPINRLKLKRDEEHQVKVIYMDLVEGKIKPLTQKYTRLSETQYKYENVPNDFEAVITVDELGLVVNYPTLFERIARK